MDEEVLDSEEASRQEERGNRGGGDASRVQLSWKAVETTSKMR